MNVQIPDKTVGRLSLYRRLLSNFLGIEKVKFVFSHQLAKDAGVTAAQVRRDMMIIGYSGSPKRGYAIEELVESIGQFLDAPDLQAVALIGVGNLGRAILTYFAGRRPNLRIVAAFDNDPNKAGTVISECRCYAMQEMPEVFEKKNVTTAIITVPAGQAQDVADLLVSSGVRGMLNFAPVNLRVPASVYVEDMDITTSLEKAAFFARCRTAS